MKSSTLAIRLLLLTFAPLLSQCASAVRKDTRPLPATATSGTPASAKKEAAQVDAKKTSRTEASKSAAASDDLDEYAVVEIADPLEKINRGTFWLNDKLYLLIFRPISKGYEKVIPKPARKGIDNAYDNIKFPVRLVNHALQGKFKRVGRETEKFLLNTVVGVGGLIRVSDKVPMLAELPDQDTGLTFAKWGMGHGAYIVIPFLGPSSVRDGIGLLGDYAMNPVNFAIYWHDAPDWTLIPPSGNTLRALPSQLGAYDAAKNDAIDPYIAVRSAYVQFREEAVRK
jgi:phospholipid-binding lipoprotein MlaA